MPNKSTPPQSTGIYYEHPPVQPNQAILNAHRSAMSQRSFRYLVDGIVSDLPHMTTLEAQMRTVERLRFSNLISGESNEWKMERIEYMIAATLEMKANYLATCATVSPSPSSPGQANINTINNHYSTAGVL